MKLTEKILAGLFLLALIMKFTLVPGGAILVVLTLSTLAIMYWALGFAFFSGIRLRHIFKKSSYAGLSATRIVAAVGAGLAMSVGLIGIQFRLMYWPGAGPMLYVAVAPLFVLVLLSLIKYIQKKEKYHLRILSRTGIAFILVLVCLLLPGGSLQRFQYRDHPQYIAALEAYWQDPGNRELEEKMELEHKRATLDPEDFALYERSEAEFNKAYYGEETEKQFPEMQGWVNDFEEVFTAQQAAELDSITSSVAGLHHVSIYVVTLDTLHSNGLSSYDLLDEWITQQSTQLRAVFITLSLSKREATIVADEVTEQTLTEEARDRILNKNMVPYLKNNDYYAGVRAGIDGILRELKK